MNMILGSVVTVEKDNVHVVTVGEVGPQGPAGPVGPAGGVIELFTASENLGGHRAVKATADGKAAYAANTELASVAAFLGITIGAASIGAVASVQRAGQLVEPTWNWTPQQPVFLGVNGLLTQTPPSAPAYSFIVGFATSPTALYIAPREPIALS